MKKYNGHHHEGDSKILDNSFVSAKVYPIEGDLQEYYVSKETLGVVNFQNFKVPPIDFRNNYGNDEESYFNSGVEDAKAISEIIHRFLKNEKISVLDWGCGSGRVLGHISKYVNSSSIWGCDINAQQIIWAQTFLDSQIGLTQCTTFPHLPFPDDSFDFIYSLSVLTHISDLPEMWLCEIRRILKPGGILYITIHDEKSVEILKSTKKNEIGHWLKVLIEKFVSKVNLNDYLRFCVGTKSPGGIQMFYNRDHLISCITRMMYSVEEVIEGVGGARQGHGYQTALVLKKR